MVNFKFAKVHCYQQIQSFLITPQYITSNFNRIALDRNKVKVMVHVGQKRYNIVRKEKKSWKRSFYFFTVCLNYTLNNDNAIFFAASVTTSIRYFLPPKIPTH
jgi:hypothetical protein